MEKIIPGMLVNHRQLGLCKVDSVDVDGIWVWPLWSAPKIKFDRDFLTIINMADLVIRMVMHIPEVDQELIDDLFGADFQPDETSFCDPIQNIKETEKARLKEIQKGINEVTSSKIPINMICEQCGEEFYIPYIYCPYCRHKLVLFGTDFQLDEALEDNSKTQSVGAKLNVIQGNVRKEKFNTTEILRTIK